MSMFDPQPQRTFGDNAGAYNAMYGQADASNRQYQSGVNNWENSRGSLDSYLQQQTYDAQMANLGFQQQDATRQNKFAQARAGTIGGSADMGAQAQIAQQGLQGQQSAFMAGNAAALGQQQQDAAYAQQLRQQGYGAYDAANQYGQFAAGNQNQMSGTLQNWINQGNQSHLGAQSELASIMGGYYGGVLGGAASSAGSMAGNYFGNSKSSTATGSSTT